MAERRRRAPRRRWRRRRSRDCARGAARKTLFAGIARFAPTCRACGLDFAAIDVGDGPAAFLILIVGTIVAVAAIIVDLAYSPAWWVHLVWLPVMIALTLAGLRLGKAALMYQIYHHQRGRGAAQQMIRRWPLIPTILVAAAIATMIGLGVWQLQRRGEKLELLDKPRRGAETAADRLADRAVRRAAALVPRRDRPLPVGDRLPHRRRAATATATRASSSSPTAASAPKGPGMAVELGWSKNPDAGRDYKGGPVSGIIAPDRVARMRLVSSEPGPGLAASAPPSPDSIPNNHLSYAIQWFLFAAIAGVIYVLALKRREREAEPPNG